MAVDGRGHLFVAWDEVLDGVRTAAFSVAERLPGGEIRFGRPVRFGPGPTQYPVMAPLAQGVVAVWTAGTPGASTIQVRRLVAPSTESQAGRPEER